MSQQQPSARGYRHGEGAPSDTVDEPRTMDRAKWERIQQAMRDAIERADADAKQ